MELLGKGLSSVRQTWNQLKDKMQTGITFHRLTRDGLWRLRQLEEIPFQNDALNRRELVWNSSRDGFFAKLDESDFSLGHRCHGSLVWKTVRCAAHSLYVVFRLIQL